MGQRRNGLSKNTLSNNRLSAQTPSPLLGRAQIWGGRTPAQHWIKIVHPWVQKFYPVLVLGSGGRLLRRFPDSSSALDKFQSAIFLPPREGDDQEKAKLHSFLEGLQSVGGDVAERERERAPIWRLKCMGVIGAGKRGHYERGLSLEESLDTRTLSRFSRISKRWSDSLLFFTV